MTQFEAPGQYADPYGEPAKTSGMAVTALISSLIFCCPLTTILGVLLGLIAVVSIGSNPAKKGRGLAIAAILLGVVFTVLQAWGGYQFYQSFIKPVYEGPREALTAGFGGDIAGFKAGFYGAGATATDEEARAFLDTMTNRYGAFQGIRFDDSGPQPQPQMGAPSAPFAYILEFEKGTVGCEVQMIFADQTTGTVVMKPGSITVIDPDQGDVVYPPPSDGS